jgi:peptide/nickel transport system permease protein
VDTLIYSLRKFLASIPLIFGVTLISFILMVYFGPDKTYDLLGKNPTQKQIEEVRHELGYDQPFAVRYVKFLKEVVTFNFGHSDSTGEKVKSIFARTIPVSLSVQTPILILGNVIALILALVAVYYRGRLIDKAIMFIAVIGMSVSFLIVVILFQIIFCSSFGLNLFPVQGWEVHSPTSYLNYVIIPVLASIFVSIGYNTRFYRAVIAEEITKDHVRTAQAFGTHPLPLLFKNILKNCLIPIITRIIITLPFIIIAGSIILESYFNIPGIGLILYDAIVTGDLPIIKAAVSYTALIYVFCLILTDILYKVVDPRVTLR